MSLDVLCPRCRKPLDFIGLTTSRYPLQCPICKELYSNSMPCPLCHAITGADLRCTSYPVMGGPPCGWRVKAGTKCSKCLRIVHYPDPSNASLYVDVDGCPVCAAPPVGVERGGTIGVRCTACRRVLVAPSTWRRFLLPWTVRWESTYCTECFSKGF